MKYETKKTLLLSIISLKFPNSEISKDVIIYKQIR